MKIRIKKASLKNLTIISLIMSILASFIVIATSTVLISPVVPDGQAFFYELSTVGNMSMVCNNTPTSGQNITNVSLYLARPFDNGSSWTANQTNTSDGAASTDAIRNFTIGAVPDGTTFTWNCRALDNASNVSWGVNRTIRVERPPTVTLNAPADNLWSTSLSHTINVTVNVSADNTADSLLFCRMYDNSSSTLNWTQDELGQTIGNNSIYTFTHVFDEAKKGIAWNVQCRESSNDQVIAFASSNRTINIDTTDPTITLNAPIAGFNSTSLSVVFNYTATDSNLDMCFIYTNQTGSFVINITNATVTSGSHDDQTIVLPSETVATEGYLWNVKCNDSANNFAWAVSTNRSVFVDTNFTNVTGVVNTTTSGNCTAFYVNWTTGEATNSSLDYGRNTSTGTIVKNTSFSTGHAILLDFRNYTDTTYYFNITSCDYAGNCNASDAQFSTTSPVSVCSGGANDGWSLYSILQPTTILGTVLNASGADFAYFWNTTGQAFVFQQAGTTTNSQTVLAYGDAVFLFDESGNTWFRPSPTTGNNSFNFSIGDNFFGVTKDYTFFNLSLTLNSSYEEMAYYNNTLGNHDFVTAYRGSSWNNNTRIKRGNVVWVWSETVAGWNSTNLTS